MTFNMQMDKRSLRKKNISLKNCETCLMVIPRNTKKGQNRIVPYQYIKARFCSKKCKGVRHAEIMKGTKNPNFKHGLSTLNEIARGSERYKKWRKSVFERDMWTCVLCEYKGRQINADHIKPFAIYPELRYLTSNGRTLCISCHKKTDSFRKPYDKLVKLYGIL